MKKRMFLASVAGLVASSSLASATQILYEPFSYSNNADLSGQSPASGQTWATTGTSKSSLYDPTVISGNLDVPSGFTAGGDEVEYGGKGYTDRVNIDPPGSPYTSSNSTALYFSYSLNLSNLGGLTVGGATQFITAFNNSTGTQTGNPTIVGAPVWVSLASGTDTNGTYTLGISNSTTGSYNTTNRPFTSDAYPTGDTLFVVGEYNFGTGTSDVSTALWVYDLTANGDALPSSSSWNTDDIATAGTGSITGISGVASFLLYQTDGSSETNTLGTNGVTLDELRVGTTWADVVPTPEPSVLCMTGVAALGLLKRRRR